MNAAINAISRIQQPETLRPKQQLADLEHQAMNNGLTQYQTKGPQGLQAWLSECWWLTAVPQQLNRFRESNPDITLYLVWQDDKTVFCEKTERGEFVPREQINNIQRAKPITEEWRSKLWMERNYEAALRQLLDNDNEETQEEKMMKLKSRRFGEITIPARDNQSLSYSDQFGIFSIK
jgi:CRISPR-associated endonuclease/helicase Cas3